VIAAYNAQFATAAGGGAGAIGGGGAAAVAAGAIPVVVAIGVWVALGSGYYQARQIIKQKAAMSGFARGFVAGVLKWRGSHVVNILAQRYVVRTNTVDPDADVIEANAFNDGLVKGFALGSSASDDAKKGYRIHLRKLAGISAAGDWSRNADEAHLQQSNYVVYLASAAMRYGVIKAE
jgi:hypothetical protein